MKMIKLLLLQQMETCSLLQPMILFSLVEKNIYHFSYKRKKISLHLKIAYTILVGYLLECEVVLFVVEGQKLHELRESK